jgi:hypothetical protein
MQILVLQTTKSYLVREFSVHFEHVSLCKTFDLSYGLYTTLLECLQSVHNCTAMFKVKRKALSVINFLCRCLL